ncbi:MAG TPA: class I SAM-dependent methyltransferase [Pyrinomonadaceae bacterium]|nr:class I SAM-dependent methyltransferase [Pyrinomonadaceae bacterium]
MYSVTGYGKMIADEVRMDAYVRAMRQAIKPGSVVIDLGSGPGVFALLAVEMGARRVFAIEPDNVIQVGREAAREHGVSDRIEFIQDFSTKVSLPEQADVIVSDLRGVLPWHGQHIPSIIDARSRLLATDGILIPKRDSVWAAAVEVSEQYDGIVKPWSSNGVTLNAGRKLAVNLWSKIRVKPENLLSQPICWHELDYYRVNDVNVCEQLSLTFLRGGIAHGLAIWFDTELFGGVGFSNAPGGEKVIYGNAFFPFKEPVEVATGDRIDVRLEARLIGEDYVWRWDTTVCETKISFKQSTLFGAPFSPEQLRKRASSYVPTLNDDGAIARFVLSQIDGGNSIEQIANKVAKEFPQRSLDENAAMNLVAEISEKYSE